jgi:phage terminase large subunit
MRKIVIDPAKNILNKFKEVYYSNAHYIYLSGGRGSGKSTAIAEKVIDKFLLNAGSNIICFRKHQNTLVGSLYTAIKKAYIRKGAIEGVDFKLIPSRLRIIDKRNGTGFFFFGLDDVQKIKSFELPTGYPLFLIIEEAQELKTIAELDAVLDAIYTFNRTILPEGLRIQIIYIFNPLGNENEEFNIWIDNKKLLNDPDDLFNHSNYQHCIDNFTGKSLLSESILTDIEKLKKNDYELYQNIFLGLPTGNKNTIYNPDLVDIVDEIDAKKIVCMISVTDAGYLVSASVHQIWAVDRQKRMILLDTSYYSPTPNIKKRIPRDLHEHIMIAQTKYQQLTAQDIARELHNFCLKVERKYNLFISNHYIDSAEGALKPQFRNDYGINFRNVKKASKEAMIENSRIQLAREKVAMININNNKIFIYEMGKYQYKLSKNNEDKDKQNVVKIDDHSCDTFQYACIALKEYL